MFYCVYDHIDKSNQPNFTSHSEINGFSKNVWNNDISVTQALKQPNHNYIYVMEILNALFRGLEVVKFSDDVLTLYKSGNLKFVVNYSHEYALDITEDSWYTFIKTLTEQGIDCKDVIIFLGQSNALDNYPYLNNFDFKYKFNDAILYSSAKKARDIIRDININGEKRVINKLGYETEVVDENLLDKKRTKRFMTMNRNSNHPHRIVLGSWIELKDYWNDFYASFLFSDIDKYTYKNHMDKVIKGDDELYNSLQNVSERFYDKLGTIEIDTQGVINKEHWDNNFEGGRYYKKEFFSDSYIHICNETNFINNELFITDKVVHPILNYQPFIVLAASGWLERFKGYGFKTFHPFINEEYDLIKDDNDRIRFILNEIERLKNISLDELHEWFTSIKDILKHNRKTLFSFSDVDCWIEHIEEEFNE